MARRAALSGLVLEITQMSENLQQAAADIVLEFAHEGEKKMETIIENAVTETGRRRASRTSPVGGGGSISPGRIDTGLMINNVYSDYYRDGDEHTGKFGWLDLFEEYFKYQEDGTKKIEAMHALSGANIAQREIALKRISDAMRNL